MTTPGSAAAASGPASGQWFGHPSAEHLEYWLDQQVGSGQLTPAQARAFLPTYTPIPFDCCLVAEPDTDTAGS